MLEPTQHSRKILLSPSKTYTEERMNNMAESFYACFAFKDKITNNAFNYTNLSFQEWAPYDDSDQHLHQLINTYKYTKKFQINCIRQRFRPQQSGPPLTVSHLRKKLSKVQDCTIAGTGCKRVSAESRNRGRRSALKVEEGRKDVRNGSESRDGRGKEVLDRAVTHMHCQVSINNQYLLNLPHKLKKHALIKEVLKQNKKRHCCTQKDQSLSSLSLQERINTLSFAPMNHPLSQSPPHCPQQSNAFLELVEAGYVNEACLEATRKPSLCEKTDLKGDNAFHVAAREGDCRMVKGLIKALPGKVCCSLLMGRNKIGRTPLEKAQMLGENETAECILAHMRQMNLC